MSEAKSGDAKSGASTGVSRDAVEAAVKTRLEADNLVGFVALSATFFVRRICTWRLLSCLPLLCRWCMTPQVAAVRSLSCGFPARSLKAYRWSTAAGSYMTR